MEQFTKEELKALLKLVQYACKDICVEDEPLLDQVYKKLKSLINGSI